MKWFALLLCTHAWGQVPYDRIVNAAKEPGNWLTYSGNYQGHRFSPLARDHVRQRRQPAREVGLPDGVAG